jgi:dTDP-4-dehydrorhamnose 3,5-epimerase
MGSVSNSVIAGLVVSPLREITDERGAVLHMLRSDSPDFAGFGEVYFSEVRPGAVKGWKLHEMQTQIFAVPIGRIQLVFFDARPDSPSRGAVQEVVLGRPDQYKRVRVPPGVWYGFGCLRDCPALLANCADLPHDPAESRSLPLDDQSIPYRWNARGTVP